MSLPFGGLSPRDSLWNLQAVGSKVKVLTKNGKLVTFELNEAQTIVWNAIQKIRYEKKKIRALILKARQQGISTLICLFDFQVASFHMGTRVQVMTHLDDTTAALFGMIKRYYDTFPDAAEWMPTTKNSEKGLGFENTDSLIKVATAGSATVGHGLTITHFHGSEVSRWPNMDAHMSGILQAVSEEDGTSVILESAAKERGDGWHGMWQDAVAGLSDFTPIFVPWFVTSEYARRPPDEVEFNTQEIEYAARYGLDDWQMYWRQRKIATDFKGSAMAFGQMYPACPADAFMRVGNSFIKQQLVYDARARVAKENGPLIYGYDPAGGGKDRGAMIKRKGSRAYGLEYNKEPDALVQAGMLATYARYEKPKAIFVDATGASLGGAIVSRLRELGFNNVHGVQFSGKADEDEKYFNKRAEMWCRMRDWMPLGSIPDDEALEQDLVAPDDIARDSHNRERLESKQDMKKRGIRSPDGGDALALTFAYHIEHEDTVALAKQLGSQKQQTGIRRKGMSH
jgi:hypothetical protein